MRVRGGRLGEQRLENFFQGAAAAQDARFHRAHATIENFGDLFVAEAFNVAQDDGAAKHFRHLQQRALHGNLDFVRGKLIEWRGAEVFDVERRAAFLGCASIETFF